MPFSERQALADALVNAAEKLEGIGRPEGDGRNAANRLHVDEFIRTDIAVQPTSGQWSDGIDKIIQAAHSADPVVYANNLRLIAKGLRPPD